MVSVAHLAGMLFLLPVVSTTADASSRPNIVIVLADDLGYGDLGCYGNEEVQTPHLDCLASQGLRFTNCYAAAPNCSPARTGLMTGRTPFRVGIYNWIPMFSPMHVARGEITIATLLRNAGYSTCHVGKWHLNGQFNLPSQPQPWDHGFSHWFSTQNNALPNHHNPDNFVRNGKPVGKLDGYSAPLVVDEAIRWLDLQHPEQEPFFLFVCFHEPHEPIATAEKYREMYPSDDPSYGAHHGNITQMDDAFGKLWKKLQEMGVERNTLLLFTSDNGPAITGMHPHGSAGPLRDKKGSLYEGGIRVPGILYWPGKTRPGTVSHEPISGIDLLPTLCAVTGIDVPDDRPIDGASILPVLENQPIARKTPLYWQFNRARSKPKVAMRVGDYKILAQLDVEDPKPSGEILATEMQSIKTARLTKFELYNLAEDIGESHDLADEQSERLRELSQVLSEMYQQVTQEGPQWPEWEWPRYEGQRIEWTPQSRRGQRAAKQ